MSTPPRPTAAVRLPDLAVWKAEGRPIVMVTAYDFPTAEIVDAAGVDIVLVGDSAANVVLGYPSTVPVSVDELLMLVAAVRRGLRRPLLVADLPFGSYEISDAQAVATAIRFVKESGADAVKLERGGTSVDRAAAIVAAGIPVMGHVGLTPADGHGPRRLPRPGPAGRARPWPSWPTPPPWRPPAASRSWPRPCPRPWRRTSAASSPSR